MSFFPKFVKCEFQNPGGSEKDTIGRRIAVDGIKPGDILIEPTSGNIGIGLNMGTAVKGFKMVITMPEKIS